MSASAYHFDRRMLFANAIVRGSLPGCSRAFPSVTPFTASETPRTRVISLVVRACLRFVVVSSSSRRRPQTRRDARVAHAKHDHPVVGEHFMFNGLSERKPVQFRAIDTVIAHIDDFDPLFGELASGSFGVEPRGGRSCKDVCGRAVERRHGIPENPPFWRPWNCVRREAPPVVRCASSAIARSKSGAP